MKDIPQPGQLFHADVVSAEPSPHLYLGFRIGNDEDMAPLFVYWLVKGEMLTTISWLEPSEYFKSLSAYRILQPIKDENDIRTR